MKRSNFKTIFILLMVYFSTKSVFAKQMSIQVKGMVCAFCAQGIEKKFKSFSQVLKVNVSLETKLVSLDLKDNQDITDLQITKAIVDSGYEVVKIERVQ